MAEPWFAAPIGPSVCTIAIALPTNREEFARSTQLGPWGYASSYRGGWYQYETLFLAHLERLRLCAADTGAQYCTGAGLDFLKRQFSTTDKSALILMSHWSEDNVELNGEMLPFELIVDSIPSDFHGIVDLCVCEPIGLAQKLEMSRANCLTRFLQAKVMPDIWIAYYCALLKVLASGKFSYVKASEVVAIEFMHH